MEFNIQKTKTLSFTRKTNSMHLIAMSVSSDCIKYLGVMIHSKLYFHVNFVYSLALRTLGLMHYIIYNLFSIDSLVVYIIL
jgi:hypothetical protein